MLYNSFLHIFLHVVLFISFYLLLIPAVLFYLYVKKFHLKDGKFEIVAIIMFFLIPIIMSLTLNLIPIKISSYKGNTPSDFKAIVNEIIDFNKKETEIVYAITNNINIYSVKNTYFNNIKISDYTIVLNNKGKQSVENVYYININNGEYIIPLSDITKAMAIEKLLYNGEYGEQSSIENKIEIYKHTKFIKSINGIDINSSQEIINNYQENNRYKINLNITEDGYFKYDTNGFSFDDFISYENAVLCMFDENDEVVYNSSQVFGKDKTNFSLLSIKNVAMYCAPGKSCSIYMCGSNNRDLIKSSNAVKVFMKENIREIDSYEILN